jgi:hypothetical protein
MNLQDLGPFPHCDSSVLHAPGECTYCDRHPEWQALRRAWGIAYTGHEPIDYPGWREVPCPSDQRRGRHGAHVWGGNRPTNIDVPVEETLDSKIMYDRE